MKQGLESMLQKWTILKWTNRARFLLVFLMTLPDAKLKGMDIISGWIPSLVGRGWLCTELRNMAFERSRERPNGTERSRLRDWRGV